jgi:hypothetical protein
MFYGFARVHQTLPVTPAIEAGVASHVWRIEEIVALFDGAAIPDSFNGYSPKSSSSRPVVVERS